MGNSYFKQIYNLGISDTQFLEDVGNNVEVNESLFQEMDDLELDDDEDDPDYNSADPESWPIDGPSSSAERLN